MVQKRLVDPLTITGWWRHSIEPQTVYRYVNGKIQRSLRGKKAEDGCKRSSANANQNPPDAG